MDLTPAELARTLIAGRRPASAYLPEAAAPLTVACAAEPDGTPLVLASDEQAAALRPVTGDDTALLLAVPDMPPCLVAPARGEAVLTGWVAPLAGRAARRAADAFAAVNPVPELLDLGDGQRIYRMDLAEVRIDRDEDTAPIELDDYQAAEPDPLYPDEPCLLAGLAHHAELRQALLDWARAAVPDAGSAMPVRLDRNGMVLLVCRDADVRHLRLVFRRPACNADTLAATVRGLCRAHP